MIYAQILNGIIKNTINLDDDAKACHFLDGYDQCVRIDDLLPCPAIGWFYDGKNFSNVHNLKFLEEQPHEIPKGQAITFEPFKVSENHHDFTVSVEGNTVTVGCHDYDYRLLRYALWKIIEMGEDSVGPIKKTGVGNAMNYNNEFHLSHDDINLLYSALCKLL